MKEITKRIKEKYPQIPVIVFPRGVGPHYEYFSTIKEFDCIALDSNLPLLWAKENVQVNNTVQGNLDPSYLVSGGSSLINQAIKINKWGKQIYVKVPVTNSKGIFLGNAIKYLNNVFCRGRHGYVRRILLTCLILVQ